MRLILLGPAGAGKGTQARVISEKHSIPQLSTGEMLRDAVRHENEIGRKVKKSMEAGHLIPDQILIDMIEERIKQPDCKSGFILDGFPRTQRQAEALDEMLCKLGLTLDAVIKISVDEAALIERLVGRFTCDICGEGYHDKFKIPKIPNVCDICGGTGFSRRDDDNEAGIKTRLKLYREQTEPIIPYYEKSGRLYRVDGMKDIKGVAAEIDAILSKISG